MKRQGMAWRQRNRSSSGKPRISLTCSSVQNLQNRAFSLQLQSGSDEEHGVSFHTGHRALHKPKSYPTSVWAIIKVYKENQKFRKSEKRNTIDHRFVFFFFLKIPLILLQNTGLKCKNRAGWPFRDELERQQTAHKEQECRTSVHKT